LVLLLGVLLTLVAMARILWPVLTRPKSHMIGDGSHAESYGFDLSTLLVSRDVLVGSGMPRDGVPVLDEPPRIGVAQVDSLAHQGVAKYLVSSDLVLGVSIGGASCCYPLLALQWHEVVNDTLGGTPIAVVYNPLCDAAVVLDRTRTDGPPRRFGASGIVWNSNLLLFDRDAPTPSLWSPLQARAVAGPAAARGESLRVLASAVLPWREWRARHPETRVLARKDEYFERYRRQPYTPYFGDDVLRFPVSPRREVSGLGPKTPCLRLVGERTALVLPVPRLLELARGAERIDIPFDGREVTLAVSREPQAAWLESPHLGLATMSGFLFAWSAACPEDSLLR